MLASIFVSSGADILRDPDRVADKAEPVAGPIARRIPYLPEDPATLARVNGAVQVGAGALLATGRLPRLSALALAASLVPTTAAGHRFWEVDDAALRTQQRTQFLKNVGLLGGLLLAAVDTEGNPSVAWRARRVAKTSRHAVRASKREAKLAAKAAGRRAKLAVS